MFKQRLIPKLQMKATSFGSSKRMVLVTTVNFREVLEIGDPVSQAKIYQAQFADELVFLDLDASAENRKTVVEVIRKAAQEIFMPITVGGGVKSVEDFRELLSNGADKVSVNTACAQIIRAALSRPSTMARVRRPALRSPSTSQALLTDRIVAISADDGRPSQSTRGSSVRLCT